MVTPFGAAARGGRRSVGRRTAVVLSGGGVKGAYEVGVMRGLFDGTAPSTGGVPVSPDIYTGTSAGAYNAVFLASRGREPSAAANARLDEVWRTQIADTPESCGNGFVRLRSWPPQYLSPGCLRTPLRDLAQLAGDAAFWARYATVRTAQFVTSDESLDRRLLQTVDISALFTWEPFERLIPETIDFGALAASPVEVVVIAANWRDGTVQKFPRQEIADVLRERAVLATAAIPGIFPPVAIDGVPFVDGAVLMNTPVSPAIRLGAEELHVIYVDPLVRDIPFPTLPDTISTLYRLYVVLVAANFRGDLTTAAAINADLRLLRVGEQAMSGREELRLGSRARVLAQRRGRRPYRELAIHVYRPRTDLGGVMGLVDFSARNVDLLIEQGHRDALEHDCGAEGCLLPGAETGAARPAGARA